ncbi:hypothetical protein [Paraflavitalea speifideaquila]|uniref:hypothetical protein n=1 Tax=Paraflavitalea speifideaquila TaxID=3076558 RepID=UPI0028E83CD2|nr:hypothetical protein [Paraflavitalea speifideiaquila]
MGLAIIAVGMSVAAFSIMLLPTKDYVKETMRGGRSELTPLDKNNKSKGGLDKDYAFNWSYGISETFTFIVPRIYGGSSPTVLDNQYVNEIGDNSKVAQVFAEKRACPKNRPMSLPSSTRLIGEPNPALRVPSIWAPLFASCSL